MLVWEMREEPPLERLSNRRQPVTQGLTLVQCPEFGVVLKQCKSAKKASQEAAGMKAAAQIASPAGLRVPRCLAHGDRFLVIEYVAGEWLWIHADAALRYLAQLHALGVPPGAMCHYHGRSLSKRLDWEVRSICQSPSSFWNRDRAIQLSSRVRALPQLRMEQLVAAPQVPGHGDFHGPNLRLEAIGSGIRVVPVDWVDFGACDARYELAHFLDSAPSGFQLEQLAAGIYGCALDPNSFREFLVVGRAMNGLISLGNLARLSTAPQPAIHILLRRLEAVLADLEA
jgi:hypothetical protein